MKEASRRRRRDVDVQPWVRVKLGLDGFDDGWEAKLAGRLTGLSGPNDNKERIWN